MLGEYTAMGERVVPAPHPVQPAAFGTSDRFIICLDGALLRNGRANADAAGFLRAAAGRFMLISTNSRDTAVTMRVKLGRVRLDVPENQIVLAGEEALRTVADRYPGARCMFAASRVLMHAARKLGLVLVQSEADVVLVGRDPTWTYQRLAVIANAVAGGAVLIGTNAQAVVIGENGRLVPDTGSLLAAIAAVTGRPPDRIIGTSLAPLAEIALRRLNCSADYAHFITGDDVAGDTPAGLQTIRIAAGGSCGSDFAGLLARLQTPAA